MVNQEVVRVLIAEDEESFVDALKVGLEREGFDVSIAKSGTEAVTLFDEQEFDLVLLDVMLPTMSGLDVCRIIRNKSAVPIIMVTAKASEIDTVVGLEIGADDYVVKPYRLRELISRMRAVLRRSALTVTAGHETIEVTSHEPPLKHRLNGDNILEVGDIRLDLDRHECTVRGSEVKLPLKEFELLQLFLESSGRVVTRETLIDRVWGYDYVGDTKTLDVHVKRLRS